jgi:hypothetical protein
MKAAVVGPAIFGAARVTKRELVHRRRFALKRHLPDDCIAGPACGARGKRKVRAAIVIRINVVAASLTHSAVGRNRRGERCLIGVAVIADNRNACPSGDRQLGFMQVVDAARRRKFREQLLSKPLHFDGIALQFDPQAGACIAHVAPQAESSGQSRDGRTDASALHLPG